MSDLTPYQDEHLKRLETIDLSQALQAVVSRSYLDLPLSRVMRPLPDEGIRRVEAARFLQLTQIGRPLASSPGDTLTALQNILTACHAPNRFTLTFLLVSDGCQNSVYLGAQSHNGNTSSSGFLRAIANFFEANWPGTRLVPVQAEDETFRSAIERPMQEYTNAVALTGVPSLKAGEARGYPQTLDRLLNGMRGKPFLYMVIAEPLSSADVDGILFQCRDLMSQVHLLAKAAITTTHSEQKTSGESMAFGQSRGNSFSESTGSTRSQQEDSYLKEQLKSFFAWGKPGANVSETQGTTHTENHAENMTISQSLARSVSSGQNIGQEHINTHAQAVEAHLQQYVKRFEQSRALGCWNVGVYLLAEREDLVEQAGMQIKALLTGEKSLYEPLRIHDISLFWPSIYLSLTAFRQASLGVVRPDARDLAEPSLSDRVEHLLGIPFSGLTTPLNTEELALLTNLPHREIAGIPLVSTASFSLNVAPSREKGIVLGQLIDGGRPTKLPYPVSLKTLVKHTLLTGITGSGKSTTCLRCLNELRALGIPFLVIEPAKDEYVQWAMAHNAELPTSSTDRIRIYMPGVSSWRGQPLADQLFLNPLDVVWLPEQAAPAVLSHVDRLKSILNASFPMQEALPILLEDLLFSVYTAPFNWLEGELAPDTARPTLRQMQDTVRTVIRQKGYEERVTANLTAALMTRIQSLRRGWKSKLFDQAQSTPWAEIFDQPTVVNLSHLGDDSDRSFAMALLMQFLYEYREARFDTNAALRQRSNSLLHLTVIEEAHRVLQRSTTAVGDEANPQGKASRMLSDMLSEIRAFGEGLLIVDQVPARLIPDAVKNTNLKIVHRIVAEDDRAVLSGCMTLTPEQTALMNRLRVGQAIVFGDQDDMAAWIEIAID